MIANWDRAVAHLLLWEGGFADRSDPIKYPRPEYVNHGVTLKTYQVYFPDATKQTIKDLTNEQAAQFYSECEPRKQIGFDALPAGYDLAALHCATMFGVHGYQRFDELAKGDVGYLMTLMHHDKMHRPQADWHYMAGWSDRFLSIHDLARELARP